MENDNPSLQLTREKIGERRKQLEICHWDDCLDGEGIIIDNINVPAYNLFLFNLRSSFRDENIPFQEYKRGFEHCSWGRERPYDEENTMSIKLFGKRDSQYFIDKAKAELLSSSNFPIDIIATKEGETFYALLENRFFHYGIKIREELDAWNFLKKNNDIFERFLEERKKAGIPRIDWEAKRQEAIFKRKEELKISFLQWKKSIIYTGNEDAGSWGVYSSHDEKMTFEKYENEIKNGLSKFYTNHANNKKISELKKSLKIYDKTETLNYSDHVLNPMFQSKENMLAGVSFIKELVVDLEIIVNESQYNPSEPYHELSEIEFKNIKSKILVLRELGIIDLLNKRFGLNNTKIAECIGSITNEKAASIRGILSNINGANKNSLTTNPNVKPALENAITVLNNLGCTDEVVKLQNILSDVLKSK